MSGSPGQDRIPPPATQDNTTDIDILRSTIATVTLTPAGAKIAVTERLTYAAHDVWESALAWQRRLAFSLALAAPATQTADIRLVSRPRWDAVLALGTTKNRSKHYACGRSHDYGDQDAPVAHRLRAYPVRRALTGAWVCQVTQPRFFVGRAPLAWSNSYQFRTNLLGPRRPELSSQAAPPVCGEELREILGRSLPSDVANAASPRRFSSRAALPRRTASSPAAPSRDRPA